MHAPKSAKKPAIYSRWAKVSCVTSADLIRAPTLKLWRKRPETHIKKTHLLRLRRIRWAKAEREGFEPSVQFNPYDGLANRSFRPLRHLSGSFFGRAKIVGKNQTSNSFFRVSPSSFSTQVPAAHSVSQNRTLSLGG